jgi:hypothetical protein
MKEIAKKFSEHHVILDEDRISMIVAPSGEMEEFRSLSYINGLNVKNGGTHIDYILNKITDALRTVIKKKYKFDVLPNQIKQHLLLATWVNGFRDLKFDSQTKERCTNTISEVSSFFDGIDFDAIAKKVVNTPEIIDPIVEAQIRKKEAQEAAELRKKNKDLDKANLRKISKFTDATEKENRRDCMIFVSEGDCLEQDTEIKVYSDSGASKKKIKDVKVGDFVLTHKNRLRMVKHTFAKVGHFLEIKTGEGVIKCSPVHRFFVYDVSTDTFVVITAENIDPTRHKLIKSKPCMSIHVSLIKDISKSDDLYDLKITHEDGEIQSTHDHRFMVLDLNTEEYIFIPAKELIPYTHCLAYI